MRECPYNETIDCNAEKCNRCGWHPLTMCARENALGRGKPLYRVEFTGCIEVLANSKKEALEKAKQFEGYYTHYDYDTPTRIVKERC